MTTLRLRPILRAWGACVLLCAGTAMAAPSVMDRVVALVEGEVVTLSELEFEARVALIQRGGVEAVSSELDGDALRSALELSIAQRLSVREADRLEIFPLEAQELESAVHAFRARFDSEQAFGRFLAEHEADVQQLANLLGRGLRANRILDSKVRLRAQVSDSEVRRYYEGHRDELGGSYEQVRAALREKLQREKYAQVARAELQKLRKTSSVRLIAPFARGEEGP